MVLLIPISLFQNILRPEGSNSVVVAYAPDTPAAPGSRSVAGEACGDLFPSLYWRLYICRGTLDHVNGGAVSLTEREVK